MIDKWVSIGNNYEVSDSGLIKYKGEQIEPRSSLGYKSIYISNNGKLGKTYFVHRLICQAFIGNPEDKPCVNHINGDRFDNRVDNLEWVTYGENNKHAYETKLRDAFDMCGMKNWMSKLTDVDVYEIKLLSLSFTYDEISVITNVPKSTISDIIYGRTWTHLNLGHTIDAPVSIKQEMLQSGYIDTPDQGLVFIGGMTDTRAPKNHELHGLD